ncbi:hypothetical protein [Stakelama saccharophila]|uniref:Uncharacterized protein n=1 Tax=Stakelama saccharophila TaxID=3075605 RepID=A0ABZ0B5H3_9SPHN|nr:hypothetical protein [Stakelama sp. W311]WNO52618.1 hypothetical protein RPR59_09065 [Stakelama sp. W311]
MRPVLNGGKAGNTLILLGTARADGRTTEAAGMLADRLEEVETVGLRSAGLRAFSYEAVNLDNDGFRTIIQRMAQASFSRGLRETHSRHPGEGRGPPCRSV